MPCVKDCLEVLQTFENQSLYIGCLRDVSKTAVYMASSQYSMLSIILVPWQEKEDCHKGYQSHVFFPRTHCIMHFCQTSAHDVNIQTSSRIINPVSFILTELLSWSIKCMLYPVYTKRFMSFWRICPFLRLSPTTGCKLLEICVFPWVFAPYVVYISK